MPVSDRDIQKLQAIGYTIDNRQSEHTHALRFNGSFVHTWTHGSNAWNKNDAESDAKAWQQAAEHAEHIDLVATMDAKVAWLVQHGPLWSEVHISSEFGSEGPTGWFCADLVARENGQVRKVQSANGATAARAVDKLFWGYP